MNDAANPFFEKSEGVDLSKRLLSLGQVLIVFILIILVGYLFILTPNQVDGESMFPTLDNDDVVLTNRLLQWFGPTVDQDYSRGDIIVFKHPNQPKEVIKRIIGVPGDVVTISGGQVFVNNIQIYESYLPAGLMTNGNDHSPEEQPVSVPAASFYVLGDNRDFSIDSRFSEIGFVKRDQVLGQALVRIFPVSEIWVVKHGGIIGLK